MKYYSIGEFSKEIGKTTQTLRNWDKSNILKPSHVTEVEKIVILYKDIIVRFGFELIENVCGKFGTVIEVFDNREKTEEQELVEDLIKIVTYIKRKTCRLS